MTALVRSYSLPLLLVFVWLTGCSANRQASIECTGLGGPRIASIRCLQPTAHCWCEHVIFAYSTAHCSCVPIPVHELPSTDPVRESLPARNGCSARGNACKPAGLRVDHGCGPIICPVGYHGVCNDGQCLGTSYKYANCHCAPNDLFVRFHPELGTGVDEEEICDVNGDECSSNAECCSRCCKKAANGSTSNCSAIDSCVDLESVFPADKPGGRVGGYNDL